MIHAVSGNGSDREGSGGASDDGDSDSDEDGMDATLPVTTVSCLDCATEIMVNGNDVGCYTCERCGETYTCCGVLCYNPAAQECGACTLVYCARCDAFRNTPCERCGRDVCDACTCAFVGGVCVPCREV